MPPTLVPATTSPRPRPSPNRAHESRCHQNAACPFGPPGTPPGSVPARLPSPSKSARGSRKAVRAIASSLRGTPRYLPGSRRQPARPSPPGCRCGGRRPAASRTPFPSMCTGWQRVARRRERPPWPSSAPGAGNVSRNASDAIITDMAPVTKAKKRRRVGPNWSVEQLAAADRIKLH